MSNQIKLNLNEEEEIHFKLSVKGSSNLPNVKPIMRFIISENSENNGMSVVLPAQPTEEGVTVKIPQLKEFFTEEKEYTGKLEIIFGNRYFSPATINLSFENPFDIQAEQIIKESLVEDIKISKPKQPEKSSIDEIPDDVLNALEISTPKKEEPAIKSVIKSTKQKKEPAYKAEFKALLRDSLKIK